MRGPTLPPLWVLLFLSGAYAGCVGCGGGGLQQVRPQLSPPVSPVDFGSLPVLNTRSVEIPLTNVGRAKLTLSDVALTKNDGIFTLATPPDAIEGGATVNLVVSFRPIAEQTYEETLTFVTDDDENPLVTMTLIGVGSTRGIIEVQPTMLDFVRVAECASSVQLLTIISRGTADLVIEEIAFTDDSSPAFTFVGSTRTPATIKSVTSTGLPGEIQLTVRVSAAAGTSGTLTGAIRIRSTDPEKPEVIVPLTANVNRAPVATIAPFGNGAPGQRITLDGSGSMDVDGDTPIAYRWTLRSKPLASMTTIGMADMATTDMTLDATVPGAYEVQLEVTDAAGAKSCQPARATVVAAPAQKLLVELFWDNAGTDMDLHVLRDPQSPLFIAPDDCHYQNRAPDWGMPGPMDDPEFVRDALTGYGPEVFGYVNPVDTTYRVLVVYQNELLTTFPTTGLTVRVYLYGVLKAESRRTLNRAGQIWSVLDVTWPSGDITVLP